MKYFKKVFLKNEIEAILRNGESSDGMSVLNVFNQTHDETDYLLSYSDENTFDENKEAEYLNEKKESSNEIEIIAITNEKIIGTAGIEAVGSQYKLKHRADFGISILKEYWEIGLGKALTKACIQCAKEAGYEQLELNVVSENTRAISLYQKLGFIEYGRNPKGFKSRINGYQEVVYMFLNLYWLTFFIADQSDSQTQFQYIRFIISGN